jgi:hypothetical protein
MGGRLLKPAAVTDQIRHLQDSRLVMERSSFSISARSVITPVPLLRNAADVELRDIVTPVGKFLLSACVLPLTTATRSQKSHWKAHKVDCVVKAHSAV